MERTKNALLFVIALCLVLIVLRLYSSGDFVRAAEASAGGPPTNLYGCARPGKDVGSCSDKAWVPVLVKPDGRVWVTSQ